MTILRVSPALTVTACDVAGQLLTERVPVEAIAVSGTLNPDSV